MYWQMVSFSTRKAILVMVVQQPWNFGISDELWEFDGHAIFRGLDEFLALGRTMEVEHSFEWWLSYGNWTIVRSFEVWMNF